MDTKNLSEKSSSKTNGLQNDVESQQMVTHTTAGTCGSPLAVEYRTNMSTKLVYLGGYFLLNLSLTLYNKALLGNVSIYYPQLHQHHILTREHTVPFPLASHSNPLRLRLPRLYPPPMAWFFLAQ
jgi:hypothetical protein